MNGARPFLAQRYGLTAVVAYRAQRSKAGAVVVAHLAEPAGARMLLP
jgi:hypothetical protein